MLDYELESSLSDDEFIDFPNFWEIGEILKKAYFSNVL